MVSGGYFYDKKLTDHLKKTGDTVHMFFLSKRKTMYDNQMNFSQLFRQIQKKNIDLLVQDELCHPSLFFFNRYWKQNTTKPLVSVVHNLSASLITKNREKKKTIFKEKRYLQTIDHFIFISRTTKQEVEHLLQCTLPGVVAWPGKDHLSYQKNHLEKKLISQQVLQVLFIGNLYPHKGLHVLIKALAQIPTEKWKLTVLGSTGVDTQYTNMIQTLLQNLHLQNHVSLEGLVSHERVSWFLRRSHLLVVPALYESFGLVYVEALGFGIPVIAAANGGVREVITDGKEGFFVKFEDIQQLKKYIMFFMKNPCEWNVMKQNASKKFKMLPTWDMSMDTISRYLHTL